MAAALSVISVAARANAPFLSYICSKPTLSKITGSQSLDETGLLSIAYSLILQLLRFRPENDGFEYNKTRLNRLSEDTSSWAAALDLLRVLLEYTPAVRYCIIHGLDGNKAMNDDYIRRDLLNVLFSHSCWSKKPFSILFTTSGQAQVLHDVIRQQHRPRILW